MCRRWHTTLRRRVSAVQRAGFDSANIQRKSDRYSTRPERGYKTRGARLADHLRGTGALLHKGGAAHWSQRDKGKPNQGRERGLLSKASRAESDQRLRESRDGSPWHETVPDAAGSDYSGPRIEWAKSWSTQPTQLGGWTQDGLRDRKSTRLNSSHVATSYAVFCLK